MLVYSISNSQTIIVEGNVAGLWNSNNSPYLIEGDITLPADSSLIIEPGVDVIFQGHYHFQIYGSLNAEGTREDSINFTINDTAGFAQLDNYSSGWGGIQFIERGQTDDTSTLKFCLIEYTVPDTTMNMYYNDYGSVYTNGQYSGTVLLENCWIRNNRMCVHSYFGTMVVLNSIISNNTGGGLRMIYNDQGLIYGNIITENVSTESMIGGMFFAGYPEIVNNTICFNTAANGGGLTISDDGGVLTVYNSIVFGNEATSGAGSMAYSAWSSIHFKNCILEGIYLADPGEVTVSVNTTSYNDLFEDTSTPVYTLAINSLAIDSGLNEVYFNSTILEHPAYDVIGNPRIQNNRIDVGAIETDVSYSIHDNSIDIVELFVYPNPAHSRINVDLSQYNSSSNIIITIVDMEGKKVIKTIYPNAPKNIDISCLSEGIYIMNIKSENINRNQLIIKQ